MPLKVPVSTRAFSAIQRVSHEDMAQLTEQEIRPLLPCLVRMSLISPLDLSAEWVAARKVILRLLSGIELVNSVVALLSIDFHALEVDVKKEQQLRQKLGGSQGDSILVQSLQNGLALEFERSDSARRLRLVLSELLCVMEQMNKEDFFLKASELFDSEVYLEEIADVLCIAQAELPALLPAADVAEALLHVKNGAWLIARMIANIPDCFKEVCTVLIKNGEQQDEETLGGRIRMQALRLLCQMNPSQALTVRVKTVEFCRMPGLAIALTLDHTRQEQGLAGSMSMLEDEDCVLGDLVSFVIGLLLGSDPSIRSWFAQFVRNGQKKMRENSVLHALREELLQRLQNLVLFSIDQQNLPDAKVVQASVLLRLYAALRGIAGLKFSEDETNLLLQLLTSHPPASPAGVRFVSLGLSVLIACSSLIGNPELERRGVEWIKWLLREEDYFTSVSGVCASFGEMMLLIAIHFHSNQTQAVIDLVCSTLGMKIAIRSNNLAHVKTIFTQEIFTEQVVTAHAVKVPVTPNLSSSITGFLPVHCIHQLLRSRAFTKHKVPIKDWIYKQILNASAPLHPILPPLIEGFVNSIIIPSSRNQNDTTNEPISEDEIYAVFKQSVFTVFTGKTGAALLDTSRSGSPVPMDTDCAGSASITPQLLLLYYLLLYEDVRLSNMRSIMASDRKVKHYSQNFLAELPMKYLLQQAQKAQQQYVGLFSSLLRLLTVHYPHLCMVQDWLYDETKRANFNSHITKKHTAVTKLQLADALNSCNTSPGRTILVLQQLLVMPARQLWPLAQTFVSPFVQLLEGDTPRRILELVRETWLKLNTVFPGRLWAMTVNALQPRALNYIKPKPLTQDDITLDPLHVLRCHEKVFRCAPMLKIVLYMLRGFLAASQTQLNRHILDHPVLEKTGNISTDAEREELKNALILTQESAAAQILLECCMPNVQEQGKENGSLLSDLREVQTLICSHLHQVFIADPTLVKLVHFQGYPVELIPIAVAGIPSMHICLDFIPELLSQPDLEKQMFGIQLVSHLCLQYALPKSLSTARLCINIMSTLMGVLPSDVRTELFTRTLPSLTRICKAFPPLCEDIISLLQQLGKICMSHASIDWSQNPLEHGFSGKRLCDSVDKTSVISKKGKVVIDYSNNDKLLQQVQETFASICDTALLNKEVF